MLIPRPAALFLLAGLPGLFATGWTGSSVSGDLSRIESSEFQSHSGPTLRFPFDGDMENVGHAPAGWATHHEPSFVEGLAGQALRLDPEFRSAALTIDPDEVAFRAAVDFSVQFWVRTEADPGGRFALLSQKDFPDNSLSSQKEAGWVFYFSGGTWAWNMGSGSRRITYERENGNLFPLNDGRWHLLAMTYDSDLSEVRLYYDGVNWVSYHVSDSEGFDFSSNSPLTLGWEGAPNVAEAEILPAIKAGAEQLQSLVDDFNAFGLSPLRPEELVHVVVDPRRLFEEKVGEESARRGADSLAFREAMEAVEWEPISEAEVALMSNPYTVHQVLNFMETAPLVRIYALVDGKVVINREAAEKYARSEWLDEPAFKVDDLAIWDRVLAPEEILASYSEHFDSPAPELSESLASLTTAAWNIWHGGKHFTTDEHGWDSRVAIAEMLEQEEVDILMMQETYSSGDFIAAELGYYFATTVDRDYLNQGSNISVLSRYPIREILVQEDSPFMNVGVRVSLSRTQDLYAMSNWYGMSQFPAVFTYHQGRFAESDAIPTLFAGDFNAVPHTDGGDSPASQALLQAGFVDAFRNLHPNVEEHPGASHRSGRRIDQLYYKGAGLVNTSTRVISTRPGGFPSDHYLILATFDLDYSTRPTERR